MSNIPDIIREYDDQLREIKEEAKCMSYLDWEQSLKK